MKIKIVTFNLRTLYGSIYDEKNDFLHRSGMILEKIREELPHVICFQEASSSIREFLKNYLKDYTIVGHGRLADYSGEGLCVAWRNDVMELSGLEQFWLSPTPYTPGTRYEIQSEYPRICICAEFLYKGMNCPIRFFNVHLDHESDEARILGINQIIRYAYERNQKLNCPTFLMGDFNSFPDSKTIEACNIAEIFKLKNITNNIGETFHDFGGMGKAPLARGKQIDYIFADTLTADKVVRIDKWQDERNGIYLSDHYPVCCEIVL